MSSGDIPSSCANCVVFKSLCWHFQLFVVVQLLSHTWLSVTPWTAACQASPSFTISPSFSDSCPLSWRCCLTISSSATLFSFCLQSFPESGSLPMSWFFVTGGQSVGALVLVLPVNIQGWFSLELTGLISWLSKGLSSVFTTIWRHQSFSAQPSLWSCCFIHPWLLEKP